VHSSQKGSGFKCPVNPNDGTFCFRYLPEGAYDISLAGHGPVLSYYPGFIKIKKGEIKDNIQITAPALGKLRLVLKGFSFEELKETRIRIAHENGYGYPTMPGLFIDDSEFIMATGTVDVELQYKELGTAFFTTQIKYNMKQDMEIHRSDLKHPSEDTLTLSGRINRTDGSPVVGARLEFVKAPMGIVIGPDCDTECSYSCISDSKGCFLIEDFRPGPWCIRCILLNSSTATKYQNGGIPRYPTETLPIVYFHKNILSNNPARTSILDLIVPSGIVTGTLYDALTGSPIKDDVPWWKVGLLEPARGLRSPGQVKSGHGSGFELVGISKGEYIFYVAAFGYKIYQSIPFSLDEGQILDLGEINLQPTGMVEIYVTNPESEPIDKFRASWPGKNTQTVSLVSKKMHISPGRVLYGEMPFGTVKITVTAKGFKPEETMIQIEPNKKALLRLMLQPE